MTSLRMRDHADNDLTLPGVTERQEAVWMTSSSQTEEQIQTANQRHNVALTCFPSGSSSAQICKFVGMCGGLWTGGEMSIDDRVRGENRGTETLFGSTEIYWEQALKRTHIPNVSLLICSINPASDALSSLLGPGLVIL